MNYDKNNLHTLSLTELIVLRGELELETKRRLAYISDKEPFQQHMISKLLEHVQMAIDANIKSMFNL